MTCVPLGKTQASLVLHSLIRIFGIINAVKLNMVKCEDGNSGPLKLIFNYHDVFYSFYYDDVSGCVHRSRDYALNYVCSGEMLLDNGKEKIHVCKGDCVFIPRDHHITMYKRTYQGERYCGIFLRFTRSFLRDMYGRLELDKAGAGGKLDRGVVILPHTVELASLFASMTPYLDPEVKPKDNFMELKLQEALMALLAIDGRFVPTMFDFNEPWKIDIIGFMEENYMCDLSIEEIAHYTGRSLATFKRDFKRVSDLTPEKWIIRKRLERAYELMRAGRRKVVDVCVEVGFRNPSHFSTAFKKQFGIAPTAVME